MFFLLLDLFLLCVTQVFGNQTPVLPQDDSLPFSIKIEEASFSLPVGIHSGAFAVYKDKWLFIAGRTNGLHGSGQGIGSFPLPQQNTTAYVVDLQNQTVFSRSLGDPTSGLTQQQIDQLSVTSPQFFYTKKTLYVSGGFGIDTATALFNTKPVLTAIDVPGFIKWVMYPSHEDSAVKHIRQTEHPLLQVTGGYMKGVDRHLFTLLVFGQNCDGDYTQQVRCFQIIDHHGKLHIHPRKSQKPNLNYRRRDLNVVPIIKKDKQAFVALSGVSTLDIGVRTPILINPDGKSSMADPSDPETFKQTMNHYVCPTVGLYSKEKKEMYIVLMGGISYGFFEMDPKISFINQVTTIKIDEKAKYTQHLMNDQFPLILSSGTNPGNPLLFGAGAFFIPANDAPEYPNGVFQLDKIKEPALLGYIVGGIMSTIPHTNSEEDSTASPYIFKILLTPRD